ncbi:MAG: DUF3179 domain-containing protein [Blastocatellia bacterium]
MRARTMLLSLFVSVVTVFQVHAAQLTPVEVGALAHAVLFGSNADMETALGKLEERGQKDIVPSLIDALRYQQNDRRIAEAISKLTGEKINGWNEAMLWQERHPEIIPHQSFETFKLQVFAAIDPQFMRFLGNGRAQRESMRIRLEEIAWGGVHVDGIPSLDNPKLIEAKEASYLLDNDLVFGVSINGDERAYPLRIMGWHEMFNETIGGVPVALAYCTLCGSGILFETKAEGREKPFVFGSSGLLYRSNKLMFDRETDSLWNQFIGEPVTGPLAKSGIRLKIRSVVITDWLSWKSSHLGTKVLSLDTGYNRNYGSGVVYADYFASPELMFPTSVRDESRIKRKDYVFGIRDTGIARAWPIDAFAKEAVINDEFNGKPLVLIGDVTTLTVRAYERGEHNFTAGADAMSLRSGLADWKLSEDALVGPGGATLKRVSGHIAYWFAWDGYLGGVNTVYPDKAAP